MKNLILLILLINSLFSFGQIKEVENHSKKRNLIGFYFSLGTSLVYQRKTRISFAGALNYSRISISGKTYFEFGVRYTQLNYRTDQEFSHYFPKSDTFRVRTGNILFFDVPINIKRVIPISEKMNLMINFGCFFTTYIKWYERSENYLTEDDSFISKEERIIKPFNYFKIGLEAGVGLSRYISSNSLIYTTVNINVRFELDFFSNHAYAFPNLTFGFRQFF